MYMKNDAMYMRKSCYFLSQNIRQISINDIIICWIDGGGWLDRWINGCRGSFSPFVMIQNLTYRAIFLSNYKYSETAIFLKIDLYLSTPNACIY